MRYLKEYRVFEPQSYHEISEDEYNSLYSVGGFIQLDITDVSDITSLLYHITSDRGFYIYKDRDDNFLVCLYNHVKGISNYYHCKGLNGLMELIGDKSNDVVKESFDYYSEISYQDYYDNFEYDECSIFDIDDINYFRRHFSELDYNFSISSNHVVQFFKGGISPTIISNDVDNLEHYDKVAHLELKYNELKFEVNKYSDEWFFVIVTIPVVGRYSPNFVYYKCDQKDSVVKLVNDYINENRFNINI